MAQIVGQCRQNLEEMRFRQTLPYISLPLRRTGVDDAFATGIKQNKKERKERE